LIERGGERTHGGDEITLTPEEEAALDAVTAERQAAVANCTAETYPDGQFFDADDESEGASSRFFPVPSPSAVRAQRTRPHY
jgi:hypothetical protein